MFYGVYAQNLLSTIGQTLLRSIDGVTWAQIPSASIEPTQQDGNFLLFFSLGPFFPKIEHVWGSPNILITNQSPFTGPAEQLVGVTPILVSSDQGQTWRCVGGTAFEWAFTGFGWVAPRMRQIWQNPSIPGEVWACGHHPQLMFDGVNLVPNGVIQELFYSKDYGATWAWDGTQPSDPYGSGNPALLRAGCSFPGGGLVVGTQGPAIGATPMYVCRRTSAFGTWTNMALPSTVANDIGPAINGIVRLSSGTILAGATSGLLGTATGQLCRSTDNGASWTNVTAGIPSAFTQMGNIVEMLDGSVVIAPQGATKPLYRSTDDGQTFSDDFDYTGIPANFEFRPDLTLSNEADTILAAGFYHPPATPSQSWPAVLAGVLSGGTFTWSVVFDPSGYAWQTPVHWPPEGDPPPGLVLTNEISAGWQLIFVPPTTTVTTIILDANGNPARPSTSVPITVRDQAKVTVLGGVIPTGSTITFRRYTASNTCGGAHTDETVSVPAGSSTATVLSSFATVQPGLASYQAVFTSGNPAIVPSGLSACEPLAPCPAPFFEVLLGDYDQGHVRRIFAGDPDDDGTAIPYSVLLRPVANSSPQAYGYFRRLVVKAMRIQADQAVNVKVAFGPTTGGITPRIIHKALSGPANVPLALDGVQLDPEVDLTMDLGLIATNARAQLYGLGQVTIRGLEWHVKAKPLTRASIYTSQTSL